MVDYYGMQYVESHWWDLFGQWTAYQKQRKPAILAWLINTVISLRKRDHDPQVQWGQDGASEPSTAADSVVIHIPAINHKRGVVLSAYHYDSMTKAGVDPAAQVLVIAKGQKWVEDHTIDKPKKKN